MKLREAPLEVSPNTLPSGVKQFLRDADRRIERLQFERRDHPIPAFVPCDFVLVYEALEYVQEFSLATGHRFVEWGSGAGVVTCLAGMLEFDAVGIEIEEELFVLATQLAEDYELDVEFAVGSFVPADFDVDLTEQRDINWLRTDGADAYEWLELEPDDFDVVFAYPWPGEEQVLFDMFLECAAEGALLLTYHGQEGMRLQRKVR